MTHKAIMAPFWSSILICDRPACDGAFGTIKENADDVRQEAAFKRGWTYDAESDTDQCPNHQEEE